MWRGVALFIAGGICVTVLREFIALSPVYSNVRKNDEGSAAIADASKKALTFSASIAEASQNSKPLTFSASIAEASQDSKPLTFSASIAEASQNPKISAAPNPNLQQPQGSAVTQMCSFLGARIPCARATRDEFFKVLKSNLPHGKKCPAEFAQLERFFEGDEWGLGQKKPWLKESKKHLLCSVAPSRCESVLAAGGRLIYIDLGARAFRTSVEWFSEEYPIVNSQSGKPARWTVHAFEMDSSFAKSFAGKNLTGHLGEIFFHPVGVSVTDGAIQVPAREEGLKNMMSLGQAVTASKTATKTLELLDFVRWLRETVQEKDLVVLKMDIEGVEHQLVPKLLETGAISLIDEFMLECHYSRRGQRVNDRTSRCKPDDDPHLRPCIHRAECVRLLKSVREQCVYEHDWT